LVLALFLSLAVAAAEEPVVRVKVSGPYVLGRADAPLTFVEFSDYECSYCQQFHARAFERIKREFVETGKLRYVVRDYPLPMHRTAVPAARAARCAAEQGHYWEMRHALFTAPERLEVDALVEIGQRVGADPAPLRACITSTRQDEGIKRDIEQGNKVGVNATPAFVIGRTLGEGVEGTLFVGSQPYEFYESRIRALLSSAPPKSGGPSRP
jgi:protein-disulfide isomerase